MPEKFDKPLANMPLTPVGGESDLLYLFVGEVPLDLLVKILRAVVWGLVSPRGTATAADVARIFLLAWCKLFPAKTCPRIILGDHEITRFEVLPNPFLALAAANEALSSEVQRLRVLLEQEEEKVSGLTASSLDTIKELTARCEKQQGEIKALAQYQKAFIEGEHAKLIQARDAALLEVEQSPRGAQDFLPVIQKLTDTLQRSIALTQTLVTKGDQ